MDSLTMGAVAVGILIMPIIIIQLTKLLKKRRDAHAAARGAEAKAE